MSLGAAVTAWAYAWLVVVVALVALAPRLGRARTAGWLVAIGLFLVWIEEPALTLWLGLSTPQIDPDGMATLISPQARAHVLDASVFGTVLVALLGWIALTTFRHGDQWATRVLFWSWVVVGTTLATTAVLVYSRGLPLPGPGGAAEGAGYGWEPLACGLLAWGLGLRLRRGLVSPPSPSSPTESRMSTP